MCSLCRAEGGAVKVRSRELGQVEVRCALLEDENPESYRLLSRQSTWASSR